VPGPLIQALAQGTCPHQLGQLVLKTSNARVLLNGQPALTALDIVNIGSCPFQVPVGAGTKPQPCMTSKLVAATKVFIGPNAAVVNLPGSAICSSADQIPAGPATIVSQTRVIAT
jgi:hypothetical protein